MRATSPPTAARVAAATLLAVAVALVAPSAARATRWVRPVPGEVVRAFAYARAAPFTAGAHRGVDLRARPGSAVRAACAGRVVHAGPVAGRGAVVSVRCGRRRVSHLPLASVTVRAGAEVRAGAPIGRLAPGHGGLHLGVRREADPFGYEDPAALLPSAPRPLPPAETRTRPKQPRTVRPRPLVARPPHLPVFATPPGPVPARAPPQTPAQPPWTVWAGLALGLTGAAGSGAAVRVRRRRRARGALLTAGRCTAASL